MTSKKASSPSIWIIIIFFVGIGYLIALQTIVSDGEYLVGDAGLKALLTQNLAQGNFGFDIKFNEPIWVKGLWSQGLFPYSEPYVYEISGKYFVQYPYTFSLVTAPFYSLFGYRGLYFIPLLATIGIWIVYYLFCRKLQISLFPTCVGGLLLIFATNLSLYSAIYWEHNLAVFLTFIGFYLIYTGKSSSGVTRNAALGGIFSGLAVWFRPEQIIPFLIITAILIGSASNPIRQLLITWLGKPFAFNERSQWVYPMFGFLTLLLYGLSNLLIYQNFLGVHSLSVIEPQPIIERLDSFLVNIRLLTVGYYSFFAYIPFALIPIIYLIFSKLKPKQIGFDRIWYFWYLLITLFVLGVAVLVPAGAGGRQWGPRFLLFIVPITTLLLAWQFDTVTKLSVQTILPVRRIVWGLVVFCGLLGILQNQIRGREFLQIDYSETRSALAELRFQAEPIIVVSDQYLAQTFQPALDPETNFLRTDTEDGLFVISEALSGQKIDSFSYLCFSFDCKLFQPDTKNRQIVRDGKSFELQVMKAVEYGKFRVFNIAISPLLQVFHTNSD